MSSSDFYFHAPTKNTRIYIDIFSFILQHIDVVEFTRYYI